MTALALSRLRGITISALRSLTLSRSFSEIGQGRCIGFGPRSKKLLPSMPAVGHERIGKHGMPFARRWMCLKCRTATARPDLLTKRAAANFNRSGSRKRVERQTLREVRGFSSSLCRKVCGGSHEPHLLLLCDGCNAGYASELPPANT